MGVPAVIFGPCMSGETGCRECRTSLLRAAYFTVGGGIKGGSRICLSCLDKLMARGGHRTVRDFTVAYVKEHKPDTIHALKTQMAEMERKIKLYETLTKEAGLQPID